MSQQPPTYPPTEPPPLQAEPTCPRHPGVVSYVRCQRCTRPTCPQCQRPAAVGIQCVDCVAEGAKTVRSGRTIFGGTPRDGRPLVTMVIIGVCLAVFAGEFLSPRVFQEVAFVPALGPYEPWRFLTSAFAHSPSTIFHIAFNMYALWILGHYLEPMLGRARFAATYLISALGGSVMFLLLSSPPSDVSQPSNYLTAVVGASGAVFGLFAVLLVLNRKLGRSSTGMYVTIGLNAAFGFFFPGIAWQAHLGGFIVGGACAAAVAYLGGPRKKPAVLWAALAGIVVVLIALSVIKYSLVGA